MLRRRKYAIIGGAEVPYSSMRWSSFKDAAKIIWRDKTLVDLSREYFGQKEVRLATWRPYDEKAAPRDQTQKEWIKFLTTHKTKIRRLDIDVVSPELLDALSHQPQIEALEINQCGKHVVDLSPLSRMPNLRELEISNFPAGLSLDGIKSAPSLRKLKIFSRKSLDYRPLAALRNLEELEIGTGLSPAFTGKVYVPNLKFLGSLSQLRHLFLYNLIPEDKDMSPLLKLTNLQSGGYCWFRGQNPSIQELAKFNMVYAEVYAFYLKTRKRSSAEEEIPIITRWELFGIPLNRRKYPSRQA